MPLARSGFRLRIDFNSESRKSNKVSVMGRSQRWAGIDPGMKNFSLSRDRFSDFYPYPPCTQFGANLLISSDPAFVLQGLNLVPFPPSKRDALGAILSSCRDEGKDPALVFSMICYDGKVLCMCQVKYLIKCIFFKFHVFSRTSTFLHSTR